MAYLEADAEKILLEIAPYGAQPLGRRLAIDDPQEVRTPVIVGCRTARAAHRLMQEERLCPVR
jgi:hypothetical protein